MAAHGVPAFDPDRFSAGLDQGMCYLDEHHHLQTEAEERAQFQRYYEIVFETFELPCSREALIQDLVDVRFREPEIEPFPDTRPVLEQLRANGLLLGVVSNAWPSLDRQYRMLGLRDYFGPFVISAQLGCCKPDHRIFHEAIEASCLPPSYLLFIDDEPEYVREAIQLGMHGLIMARQEPPLGAGIPIITTLAEVHRFL